MTVLSSQFNLLLSLKMNISDSDKMPIDEFDLMISMYEQYIIRLESEKK